MKRMILTLAAALMCTAAVAQAPAEEASKPEEGYLFTIEKELKVTPVKNQNSSGTCWDYAGTGFLEAELLRMGKGEYDLSEMFTAYHDYCDRAMASIRKRGDISYSQGGCFGDVLHVMERYGLVPEEQMRPGVTHRDSLAAFGEMSSMTNPLVKAACGNGSLQADSNYQLLAMKAIRAVLQVYLGIPPEKFTYRGREYTPASFRDALGLKASDYVQVTAVLHEPLYGAFAPESPDNWRNEPAYNVTLDELIEITDLALAQGYPVGWDSDVSEPGWRLGIKKGFVVLPANGDNNLPQGTDMEHWAGKSAKQMQEEAAAHPTPQRWVTPEERQLAWDNHETNDDHLMLIYGTAKDQMGNPYYMVKNSWGRYGEYNGMFYCSKAYFRYKTITVLLHKDALSKAMKKKLDIR